MMKIFNGAINDGVEEDDEDEDEDLDLHDDGDIGDDDGGGDEDDGVGDEGDDDGGSDGDDVAGDANGMICPLDTWPPSGAATQRLQQQTLERRVLPSWDGDGNDLLFHLYEFIFILCL